MFQKKRLANKILIFVIGSGRSGTHLLGRTVGQVNSVLPFMEAPKTFMHVTKVAVNPNRKKKDVKGILKLYENEFSKVTPTHILEKTHPNIWLVEDLLRYFCAPKFIGIKRNIYATVASMLKHEGVLRWYEVLPLDQENPFLGITAENRNVFKHLPLESKCALRWKSHTDRLDYLQKTFPKEVMVIDYEDFYNDYDTLMNSLEVFLKLQEPIQSEPLISKNTDRWKSELTEIQIQNIDNALKGNYKTIV